MLVTKGTTNQSVNIRIVDSTDGTPETGVVFNTAGIDMWYRREGAAETSITEVTLAALTTAHTDGGFLHISDGWYRLDVPDAAFATGVNGVQIGGTVTGMVVHAPYVQLTDFDLMSAAPDVNVLQISSDATAADNLEAMYDGTGYTDDVAPSTQSQLNSLTVTGAAVNVGTIDAPNGFTLTTGSEVNDEDSTRALDGTRHELTDATGTLDCYYEFDIEADGIPTGCTITGVFNGSNDVFNISANAGTDATPVWQQIGTITGSNSTSNVSETFSMLVGQIVTDIPGRVQIRINGTGLTTASFDVDQIIVSKAVVNRSIGYADGAVWLDTNASNTGTVINTDGVADNPVSTIAAALTLCTNIGISRIRVAAGSTFTMAADFSNFEIMGDNYTIAFGGQTITNAKIVGATVSGTFLGATAILTDCIINAITGPGLTLRNCYFNEVTMTNNGTAGWYINDCRSRIAGTGRVTFDFGAAAGSTGLSLRNYSGGIELTNMGQVGTDNASLEGNGNIVLAASCIGGTAVIRGNFDLTDNSATTTITQTARPASRFDGIEGATFATATDSLEAIRDRGDAAWITGAAGSGLTPLASGTAQGGTASTIQLAAASTFADDILNGNSVKITSGTGAGQARVITDYVSATDTATVTPNWATNPDATSVYEVVDGSVNLTAWLGATATALESAADVWTQTTRTLTAATNITSTGGTTVPQTGDSFARLGAPAGASVSADIATRMAEASINTTAGAVDNVTTVATTTTNTDMRGTDGANTVTPLTAAGVRAAVGLAAANLDTQLGTLATAAAQAVIDGNVDAIRAITDQMVFTKANELDVNTQSINGATVVGDGNATPWDGA